MPWINASLREKYGNLVRIGPSHVSANSMEAIDAIYVEKKGFQKSGIYGIFQPYWEGKSLHSIFSTQDIEHHTLLKRNVGHLYSMSAVIEMESRIYKVLTMLLKRFAGFAREGSTVVDMSSWLQYYTFDAQAEINFSTRIGFIESGTDVGGFCHLDHEMMTYFARWGQIPSIERIVGIKSYFKKPDINPLYKFVLDRIHERFEKPTNDPDFLNAVIKSQERRPDTITTREVIAAHSVTGHDVTAIQLQALAYYIVRTPQIYERLRAEIDTAVKSGKVSTPAKYIEILDLPYLSSVIYETLRIHPSAGLILERVVPPEGIVLHDTYLPPGTTIGVNAWAMNRNKAIFGEDIESFRPERWSESVGDNLKAVRRAMFTFGAGARSCIGKNMAMLQLYKVIFRLFRNYDVEWPQEKKSWSVVGGRLTRQTNMEMRLTLRTH